MIHLAWPWVLLLAPLPLLLRWLLPKAPSAASEALRWPAFGEIVDLADGDTDTKRSRLLEILLASALWLLLLLAASRPQWLGEPVQLPVAGRDLLLAVDLSRSMAQTDFVVNDYRSNRLEAVKKVAGRFLQERQGDRLGLILFGSQPYLQTPLTFDRQTVSRMLEEAEIGLAGRATAIGDAIGLAVKRLSALPAAERVLILLTDGANTAGTLVPLEAARLAADDGIRIYTIGLGADAMRVRSVLGSRVVNPSSDLDEETLTRIAELTGGRYFRVRDTEALEETYQELDRLEPRGDETESFRPVHALYPWPLGLALLLSTLWGGISLRWRA
ncbi:MAG: VWA domain-containing protein [Chromatiales bacterium]|nr:VWA domain-containing protein [Chromatiales bacterium]